MQGCYVIHLFEPVGSPQTDEQRAEREMPPRKPGSRFSARHYIGYSINIERRVRKHRNGTGAKLLARAGQLGIRFDVARIWPGEGEEWEKYLKRQKNAARLCPICNQNALNCCTGREEEE